MTWQAPNTAWTTQNGVADVDMNRIEGNIADLNTRKQDITSADSKYPRQTVTSTTTPDATLYPDGSTWYNPTYDQTKMAIGGVWKSVSGGSPAFSNPTNNVTLATDSTAVTHGISGFQKGRDLLVVNKNTALLQPGVHYTISTDGLQIASMGAPWAAGEKFYFQAWQPTAIPTQDTLQSIWYENYVTPAASATNIPIGITQYDSQYDHLEVWQGRVRLKPSDWNLNANNVSIDLIGQAANGTDEFTFIVVKKIRDLAQPGTYDASQTIIPGSITKNLLGTSIIPASVSDQLLTTTTATDVVTYTPTAQGNFEVKVYIRIVTAATNVTINVTYNDGGGTQTYSMQATASLSTGSHGFLPYFFNATTAAPIKVTVTAGTASQVYVSTSIVAQ